MKLFTIFGNPVSHSISPLLHNSTIKSFGLDACYTRTLLDNGNEIISTFDDLKLNGANVTVPYKENAYKLCDKVKGIAKEIGAVNTLVKEDKKIFGYNTDAQGFYESIKSFKNIKNALILGAGGTAKAISFILNHNNIKTTILNRSEGRLHFFENNGFETFSWKNFKSGKYDLIINTTPAGLKDSNYPLDKDILDILMQNSNYVFDVVYGKITPFLALAKKNLIANKDGSDMLLYQAIFAFNLFYQNKFDIKDIEKHMRAGFTLP